ncbi:MAG: selenium metabolism-associated LysR family transcriptional regulator [Eubacteriales bacterium]|nr:selenium metabolism-associated LysR family transcriptional regulator [Eubacteriales bacterium]
MDFKQLKSYITVVEEKSFTKASEVLFIAQPTISTHIRSLEEQLHHRLIIRSTKSIEITPKGWELYEAAKKIMEIEENLLERWNSEEKHILKIGASTLPSAYILPDILPGFSEKYPNIYFVVNQGDSEKIIQQVLDDQCKVGMIGMSCEHKNLECKPFFQDQMTVITPVNPYFIKKYEEKKGKMDDHDLLELLKEPIIVRESGSGTQKNADRLLESLQIKESDLNITARINDPESIKNLVASGLGISLISKKAAENYCKENRILTFDLDQKAAKRNLYLIYKKDYYFKDYVNDFLAYVLNYYR